MTTEAQKLARALIEANAEIAYAIQRRKDGFVRVSGVDKDGNLWEAWTQPEDIEDVTQERRLEGAE